MTLVKQLSTHNDKVYDNYYLVWRHADKLYAVRVQPSFYKDIDKLYAVSERVPEGEPFEKYY